MLHTAYGLRFASELALPELVKLSTDATDTADDATSHGADVTIRYGAVDPKGIPDGRQLGPHLWVTDRSLWLQVPRVARYLVSNGEHITIDPAPGIDEDSLRVFLLGSAMGALLSQRGHLVLHGNAIRIGDYCMVCVGPSGAGKSTLAAGFLQRGHEVLADDVIPVDDECRALPGFPRIKLWEDAACHLGVNTAGLRRIRPDLRKYDFPLANRFCNQALPIRWVYVMDTHPRPEIRIERTRGMARFASLRDHTYRVRYLDGLPLRGTHLRRCGELGNRIHLGQVTRPNHGFELDRLVDAILDDMAAHP